MSGIYIPNMEMPKSCSECRFLVGDDKDGMCLAAEVWMEDDFWMWFVYDDGDVGTRKPLNCPLVPVPPHGRLIDADALYTELAKRKSYGELSAKSALRAVANAPTIIPSSEEGAE